MSGSISANYVRSKILRLVEGKVWGETRPGRAATLTMEDLVTTNIAGAENPTQAAVYSEIWGER